MRIIIGIVVGVVIGFGIGRMDPATFDQVVDAGKAVGSSTVAVAQDIKQGLDN